VRRGTVAVEIPVEYLTQLAAEVSVRARAFLDFVDGRLEDLRVYVDLQPLAQALDRLAAQG
jgi:hypothetical protein